MYNHILVGGPLCQLFRFGNKQFYHGLYFRFGWVFLAAMGAPAGDGRIVSLNKLLGVVQGN